MFDLTTDTSGVADLAYACWLFVGVIICVAIGCAAPQNPKDWE